MEAERRERHNSFVRRLEERLTKKGYITKVEPRITIDGNLRIPDLVAWEKDQSIVCDVTIVSDTAPLDEVHTSKVQKYDDKDVQIWMTNKSPGEFPPPKVYVTALVWNWRGVISSKSYTFCGNITSENRKSDGGKELDCSDDIYCVMHGLIFKCWLRIMSRGSLRPRRGL